MKIDGINFSLFLPVHFPHPFNCFPRCLDVTSTHASSTGDYDPNVTSSECNDPKFFRPRDTMSAVLYGPRFPVHPCFDLDVMSHVTLRPT